MHLLSYGLLLLSTLFLNSVSFHQRVEGGEEEEEEEQRSRGAEEQRSRGEGAHAFRMIIV